MSVRTGLKKTGMLTRASALAMCAALGLSASACAKEDADATETTVAEDVASGETRLAMNDEKAGKTEKKASESDAPAAPADQAQATESVEGLVSDEASSKIAEKRAKLLADAVEALKQTNEAIDALDNGDKEAALEALALATGKLDVIVAREPELALAPVDVATVREDLIATVDGVKSLREEIDDLVDKGEIQEARPLINAFGSEIRIQTTSIPLATYPDAMKTAAALIDDDQMEEAKVVLDTALSTLVVTEAIVPLPLLRAHAMLDLAEAQITGEGDADTEDAGDNATVDIESLLENASYQVELAKAFGYGDKSEYRKLQNDMKKLKERVEDDKDAGDLFASLRRQLSGLMPGDGE